METAPLSMLRHNNRCSAALCSGSVNTTHSDQSLSCPESAPPEYQIHPPSAFHILMRAADMCRHVQTCADMCRHVHRVCTEAAALLDLLSAAAQWAGREAGHIKPELGVKSATV